MKNIFESGEVMSCYAQIDYCYLMLRKLNEELTKPQEPIERMIDNATGFGADKVDGARKTIIELLKTVIKCKKEIEADYSGDERFLNLCLNSKVV